MQVTPMLVLVASLLKGIAGETKCTSCTEKGNTGCMWDWNANKNAYDFVKCFSKTTGCEKKSCLTGNTMDSVVDDPNKINPSRTIPTPDRTKEVLDSSIRHPSSIPQPNPTLTAPIDTASKVQSSIDTASVVKASKASKAPTEASKAPTEASKAPTEAPAEEEEAPGHPKVRFRRVAESQFCDPKCKDSTDPGNRGNLLMKQGYFIFVGAFTMISTLIFFR